MTDFSEIGFVSSLIEVFEAGLDTGDFSTVVGEGDYGKLDYPIAQFYPDQSVYQGGQEYEDSHTVFFIFEQKKNESQIVENTERVEKALDNLMGELEQDEITVNFKPDSIRYLIGENDNNLLDVIQVEFSVSKIVDFQ